jgi:hypothetical protein
VRRRAATKTVAFHDPFKAAALGDADGIHKIAGREQRRANDVARLHFLREIAEFPDAFDCRAIVFLDVPEQRLRHALFFLVVESELNGVVTVLAGLGFHLQDAVWPGEHDGDGHQHPARVVNTGAAEFFS